MLSLPLAIIFSKWTYIVIAVILALICGALIWLGGYETPAAIFAGAGATQTWSWRYENLQKAGVICGGISASLIVLITIASALFGGNGDDSEYDEYYE